MKKIILASNSAQRKNLLKLLPFKFSVKPSQAAESRKITTTFVFCMNNMVASARSAYGQNTRGAATPKTCVVSLPQVLVLAVFCLIDRFEQYCYYGTHVQVIDQKCL